MTAMKEIAHNDNLEERIIAVARQTFIENGFTQTNMSDIAARVGINRPALHYYFRTKEKMYRAVFSSIVSALFPKIRGILTQHDMPIGTRIGIMVDAYYTVFKENPSLPLFVAREMKRDMDFLVNTIRTLQLDEYMGAVIDGLQKEMDDGRLKKVPLPFVFYTFYGLLIMPFIARRLTESVFATGGQTFDGILEEWKPYIVRQMECLLATGKDGTNE